MTGTGRMDLKRLLGTKEPAAARLAAAVTAAEAEYRAAAAEVERLTGEHRRALVEGDAAAVDRVEAELVSAGGWCDRADAALGELRRRLREAAEAERGAAAERLASAAHVEDGERR